MTIDDQAAGVDFAIVRHAGKANNALDILKGVLEKISVEKLCMAISHAETKPKIVPHTPQDGHWVAMD